MPAGELNLRCGVNRGQAVGKGDRRSAAGTVVVSERFTQRDEIVVRIDRIGSRRDDHRGHLGNRSGNRIGLGNNVVPQIAGERITDIDRFAGPDGGIGKLAAGGYGNRITRADAGNPAGGHGRCSGAVVDFIGSGRAGNRQLFRGNLGRERRNGNGVVIGAGNLIGDGNGLVCPDILVGKETGNIGHADCVAFIQPLGMVEDQIPRSKGAVIGLAPAGKVENQSVRDNIAGDRLKCDVVVVFVGASKLVDHRHRFVCPDTRIGKCRRSDGNRNVISFDESVERVAGDGRFGRAVIGLVGNRKAKSYRFCFDLGDGGCRAGCGIVGRVGTFERVGNINGFAGPGVFIGEQDRGYGCGHRVARNKPFVTE